MRIKVTYSEAAHALFRGEIVWNDARTAYACGWQLERPLPSGVRRHQLLSIRKRAVRLFFSIL